jgi:2,4-dienoyl-CoA reductase-like NADH-dependent reductase (Old Yellow Enzyme family)/thioredoxin reductase
MLAKQEKLKHLFSPLTIKGMELRNRIVMPPMGTLSANVDSTVSERQIEYYEARAKGGAGLVTVEISEVHISSSMMMLIGIHDDKFIPGLTALADRVHSAGAKIAIQLHHPGRQFPALGPDKPPWAPSPVPCTCPFCQDMPHVMTIPEIEEMVEAFAQGARRAKEAGFDAVEIHGAHGYLVAQFMSPLTNQRTDRYGGDMRSRMLFAVEVIEAVRGQVGPDYPIIFRLSGEEGVPGGRELEEVVATTPMLVDAGVDCISVSTGLYANTFTHILAPMEMPRGLNVCAAEAIKRVVEVPVTVVGRLNDLILAESVLARGKADLVGIGRGLLADPELPNKAAAGQFEDIRWCIACNRCIEGLMTAMSLKCVVNPELGKEREFDITPALKPKRVLVAGGGPAGMEAARVAALRGHQVTLYERQPELGGQFRLASIPPQKQELILAVKYQARSLANAGVEVILNTGMEPSIVEEMKPDAIVVATGGAPRAPDVPGATGANVVTAWDVLAGKAVTGKKVVVIGGGVTGCETAEFIAQYGKEVTIVEMLPEVASDGVMGRKALLAQRLSELGAKIMTLATLKLITADGVVVARNGEEEVLTGMDTIVLAMGVTPVRDLAKQLEDRGTELYVIGDAENPASALEAFAAGAEVGRKI